MLRKSIIIILLSNYIVGQTLEIEKNIWKLFGAKEDIEISILNNKCINIVWKYNYKIGWEAYSPLFKIQDSINNSNNISLLNDIKNGYGFWILGDNNCIIETNLNISKFNLSKFDNNVFK